MGEKTGRTLLWVYGSLRQGGWNQHFLSGPEVEFIGPAQTVGRCALYVCSRSGLPYLMTDAVCQIKGELYAVEVEVLRTIDDLEGHPDSYCRMPVDVQTDDGQSFEAEAYFWLAGADESMELVPSGDWLDAQSE